MEWSYDKNRMASALERLIDPKKKKKVRWRFKYFCCCCKVDDNDISHSTVLTD